MSPTAQELINELAMSSSFSGHLVVEGVTDQKLLNQALPKALQINVIPVGNCQAALEVAAQFQTHPAKSHLKFAVLVDRDYQVAINSIDKLPNVVVTELRDIECMMFNSVCFDRVASEYLSESKLEQHKDTVASVKQKILEIAAAIGCVRYASQCLGWNLSFKALDFEKFVKFSTSSVDVSRFVNHLNGAQTLEGSTNKTLKRISQSDYEAAKVLADNCPELRGALYRARGHDLFSLMCSSLRKQWGNKSAKDLTSDLLEKTFRIAYPEIFRTTSTFSNVCAAL